MRIHVLSLILSFCIGISVMMCLVPKPVVVVKFPRPDTDDYEYKADDGTCFKVASTRVSCESGKVKPQPVHEYDPQSEQQGLQFQLPFT